MSENNVAPDSTRFGFDPSYGYTLQDLLNVIPPSDPEGFDDFWQTRYRHALEVAPLPQLKDSNQNRDGWRVFDIRYTSTDDFPIRGWLLLPDSGIIRRGFIIGHGYGGRNSPDFHLPFKDAALLFPCFRGLSLSSQAPISSNPSWHVLHHIDQRDQYILGGCVEDIWLAVSALLRLFPQLNGYLGYLGISFGGGIGALALAFESRIARGHLNLPTFGHQLLRLELETLGSAASVQHFYRSHKEQTLKVLPYYDAAIAARRISMPVHCACALFDPCVAPPGQFAIYNALAGEKALYVVDAGHYSYANQGQQAVALLDQLDCFFKPMCASVSIHSDTGEDIDES